MGKHNDGELKKILEDGVRSQFSRGLLQGTTAICTVIREKASNKSKTPEERINDIIAFCDVSLKKG